MLEVSVMVVGLSDAEALMAETAEIHQNKKLEKAAIHQTKKLKNC
jgi:hypothetical protein